MKGCVNMTASLSDPGALRELLQRHGLRMSKALGQNFLINPSVCPRMAEACGAEGCALLQLVQPVNQRVPVNIKLSGGF